MRDLQAALRQTSTATLSMQLLKRGLSRVWMRGPMRLSPQQERLAAPAFTLRFIPGREDLASPAIMARKDLAQRRAIEECSAGHVLVVDALGFSGVAVMGDILASRLRVRGVSGMVTDGAVRHADAVVETGLPVWCAGAAAPPSHDAVVALLVATGESQRCAFQRTSQVAIGCGGVAVVPGDWIVADGDGVVVVPAALAPEVAEAALEQEAHEGFILSQVEGGAPIHGTYPPDEANVEAYRKWRAE